MGGGKYAYRYDAHSTPKWDRYEHQTRDTRVEVVSDRKDDWVCSEQ